MLIFDVFKGQYTDTLLKLMDETDCAFVIVPPNLMNSFQSLDLNINGFTKTFFKKKSSKNGTLNKSRHSTIKPLHARWLISIYDNLRNKKNMIKTAFEMSSISEALDDEFVLEEDPFLPWINTGCFPPSSPTARYAEYFEK